MMVGRQAVPSASAKWRSSDLFGLDLSTAQPKTREFVEQKIIELEPYTLHMGYGHWSYGTQFSIHGDHDFLDRVTF